MTEQMAHLGFETRKILGHGVLQRFEVLAPCVLRIEFPKHASKERGDEREDSRPLNPSVYFVALVGPLPLYSI